MVERIVAGSPGPRRARRRQRHRHRRPAVPAAGCRVLGVDPDARMAALARRHGSRRSRWPTFEDWEPAGRHFDAVVAGQSWHWVDPVAGAAKAARVLRPGGRLAVFWNVVPAPARAGRGLRRGLPAGPARPARSDRAADAGAEPYGAMFATAAAGSGRPARSPSRSAGASTGTRATPGTSGSTRCRPTAARTGSRRPAGGAAPRPRRRDRRRRRRVHDGLQHRRGHRDADARLSGPRGSGGRPGPVSRRTRSAPPAGTSCRCWAWRSA